MNAITHPLTDAFLMGFITAASLVAALFFLRFWRDARDSLFLAFAAFFGIQAVTDVALLNLARSQERRQRMRERCLRAI
jgi:ABC-type Fe3+-siderophore transport system permease subunit